MNPLQRKLLLNGRKSALKSTFSSVSRVLSNSYLNSGVQNPFNDPFGTLFKRTFAHISQELKLYTEYEPVIGLEVHAQLELKSKLFSDAINKYAGRANSHVSPFDLSLPGSLPRLNRQAVLDAIRTGLALNCKIPYRSTFDRKHYFYADLPNGYQITQQREPIAYGGFIDFIVYDLFHHTIGLQDPSAKIEPYLKRCYIKQIQLEQDSGKSLVDTGESLIDLNRAGVALLEFVFEPELCSTMEATCLIQELIQTLQILGTCSGKLEEGALRVDANISVRKKVSKAQQKESVLEKNPSEDKSYGVKTKIDWKSLGTRTEVKNLNSFRFLRGAVQYEIKRQIGLLQAGESIVQETLSWDLRRKCTVPMRDKEIVQDYRFMPEPNLPPIFVLGGARIDGSSTSVTDKENSYSSSTDSANSQNSCDSKPINLAELEAEVRQIALPAHIRLQLDDYSITLCEKQLLVQNTQLLELFKEVYDKISQTITSPTLGISIFDFIFRLTSGGLDAMLEPVSIEVIRERILVENLSQIVCMTDLEKISNATAVDLIRLYIQGVQNRSPEMIVEQLGWELVKDPVEIERICRQVAEEVPKVAKKFAKNGVRKPRSMLIQKAQLVLGNRADEEMLWNTFEKILR